MKMNEIVWLSHGGPGSGRYPKGSGKKYKKQQKKRVNKELKELNKIQLKRSRVYTDLKFTKDRNDYAKLIKIDNDLIKKGNNIRKKILSENKNIKLKDTFGMDMTYAIKYLGKEPYAGAYNRYKVSYK